VRAFAESIPQWEVEFGMDYMCCTREKLAESMIRTVVGSVADMAVIPMPDYLGLGNEARINTPATLGNNWKWRMKPGVLTPQFADNIRKMAMCYGRLSIQQSK
nr:4-alpha-glucanotransferase [Lachnospiraceae bacterium]